MKVSLVMPTWNAGPLLEEVLAAVDAQPGAADLEKVAVDSGSADGTVGILEKHGFRVMGIEQKTFNHGATRDLAIEQTSGDVILLLTQDATPADGKVELRLRVAGDQAIVEVRDTGCGMDAEFIRTRLFRPFDSTKGLTGMGIGAYECREVISALGGQVVVESKPGAGTTFRIMLPLADNVAQAPVQANQVAEGSTNVE